MYQASVIGYDGHLMAPIGPSEADGGLPEAEAAELRGSSNQRSILEDCLAAEPPMPSLRSGTIYLTATVISSAVVFGLMMVIGSKAGHKPDPSDCTCDCFDRRFKGLNFEDTKQYRHVYFNMTTNTGLLFFWSILHLSPLIAFANRAVACLYFTVRSGSEEQMGCLRWRVLVCSCVNFYGLAYGWWVVFNYINDSQHWSRMGNLWPTQLFFSLTDLIPAYAAYCLLAQGSSPPNSLLRLSLVISSAHILLALWDQGFIHILTFHPLAGRDIMFFISDVAGVLAIAPYTEMKSGGAWRSMARTVLLLCASYLALKIYVGGE